ncbi:MAG: competence/damage-inducible protein A [Alistipes sp.]|nr:competence/damage-inducible protein A [Alistipes sp.]
MKATIITIGDEILIGQIVDTNSVSIARHLNGAGITVESKLSIGDSDHQIESSIRTALLTSQVVVITGGLGPTKDDITKHTLARIFNSELRYNDTEGQHIESLLARRGIAFTELNRSQAMLPACCTPLHNAHGTAPGMWFECEGDAVVVSLPGVPFEMEHLMQDEVIPRLKKRFMLKSIVHLTLITHGIAESLLAERIAAWEDALPDYMHLAYLPAPNIVRLRLSAYDVERSEAEVAMRQEFGKLEQLIGDHIVGEEGASVESNVHRILSERGLTLATAESCTGGNIAASFTSMAGASAYFLTGIVAYSNAAKSNILGVDSATIERHGAVSREVVEQMAEGARRISGADYAIATSGIAGPSGGSVEKPVGTVWMAVATPTRTISMMRNSGTDRQQIIKRASAYVVEMLYNELRKL